MFFADGNDKPFWSYSITLAPGQTKTIASFVTGQPTRVAAAQKAAAIASGNLGGNLGACMTSTEKSRVSNFAAAAPATEAIPVFSLPVLAGLSALLGLFGFGFVFNRRNRT